MEDGKSTGGMMNPSIAVATNLHVGFSLAQAIIILDHLNGDERLICQHNEYRIHLIVLCLMDTASQ